MPHNELFFSTHCMRRLPWWETLRTYEEMGLKKVELGSSNDHLDNPYSEIKKSHLDVLVHNYFPPPRDRFILNLSSPNKTILKRTIDFAKRSIGFCADVGSPLYSIHAGFVNDPILVGRYESFCFKHLDRTQDKAKAIQRMMGPVRRLTRYALDRSVKFAIENNMVSGHLEKHVLLSHPEEIIDFFTEVSYSNLGLLLDLGHLNTSAYQIGTDLRTCVAQLVESGINIHELHIHTNDGERDEHRLPPRDDWIWEFVGENRALFATVEAVGLTPATIEELVQLNR